MSRVDANVWLWQLPDNLNGRPAISGSGPNRCGPKANGWNPWWRIFDRGSLGPSTVTFIAFVYVATWIGIVDITIVSEKLFPGNSCKKFNRFFISICQILILNSMTESIFCSGATLLTFWSITLAWQIASQSYRQILSCKRYPCQSIPADCCCDWCSSSRSSTYSCNIFMPRATGK